jgi:chemotaxis protein MotB
MMRRSKPKYLEAGQGGQRDSWLISYTDFVTVLLILFVAIAAQGIQPTQGLQPQPPQLRQPSAKPNNKMAAPIQPAPITAANIPEPTESHQALVRADEKLRSQGLDSRLEKRGLVISLPQAVLFPSGEDHIMPTALPIVSQIAEVISSVPNKVALVGHADSIPIHNKRFQSNWELSAARSVNLLEVLSTRYGISESRLSVQSYGSIVPKDSNDTAAGRAENRRVEILLLDETAQ